MAQMGIRRTTSLWVSQTTCDTDGSITHYNYLVYPQFSNGGNAISVAHELHHLTPGAGGLQQNQTALLMDQICGLLGGCQVRQCSAVLLSSCVALCTPSEMTSCIWVGCEAPGLRTVFPAQFVIGTGDNFYDW